MPYTLLKTNGTVLTVVQDGTIDTTTDLTYVGKNYTGYGNPVNDNFVKLLENFSNNSAPTNPLMGQLWYDSINNVLKLYDGTKFKSLGIISHGVVFPSNQNSGDLYFSDSTNILYAYNGTSWVIIGGSGANGVSNSGAFPTTVIQDTNDSPHTVIEAIINNNTASIFSADSQYFSIPSSSSLYNTYPTIYPGINLSGTNSSGISGYYDGTTSNGNLLWGTAGSALGIVTGTYPSLSILRATDLVDRYSFSTGLPIPMVLTNDVGIVVGTNKVLQLSSQGNIGTVSGIFGSKLQFSVNTGTNTFTNVLIIDGTNGLKVLPNSIFPVSLGSTGTGNSFVSLYVGTIYGTNVITTSINATTITGTFITANTVTSNKLISDTASIGFATITTGSVGLLTGTTISGTQVYDSGARVLTTSTLGNYGVVTIIGTPNQINSTVTSGAVTLSLANTLTVGILTASTYVSAPIVYSNGLPCLTSATVPSSGVSSIQGTANQIVSSALNGPITLSLPSTINISTLYGSQLYDNGNRVLTNVTGVASFSGGSTGLQPYNATTGSVVLSGVLNAASGGSGVTGNLTGVLYANGASAYTTATGSQLASSLGSTVLGVSNIPWATPGFIGSTTPNSASFTSVSVNSTYSSNNPFNAYTPNNGTTGAIRIIANSATNLSYLQFTDNALNQTGYMQVSTTSNLLWSGTITANDFIATSDERLKSNILTINNALDIVTQLRGTKFNKTGSDRAHIGVIAQEVQQIVPELVYENEDGYLGVAYANMVGLLIEAIKEQQQQINELMLKIGN